MSDQKTETNSNLRKHNAALHKELDDLHEKFDRNYVLFFRRLDTVPEFQGPKRLCEEIIKGATDLIKSTSAPENERIAAISWLNGEMRDAVIQPQQCFAAAGLDFDAWRERGQHLNMPKLRKL